MRAMIDILKKEILENLTTFRFEVLTALLFMLMLTSIIVSYGDYHQRVENYSILRPSPGEHDKIILPPEPLSIFARGIDANAGRLYQLSALGIAVQSNQQSINRLFSLFTLPDMLFVVKVILALIAILFSFDAVSGEKEQGTLKLMLAGRTSRASVVLGKLSGRFLLVFVPFCLLFLVSAIAVSLLPDVPAGMEYWGRIALITWAAGLYMAVFTAAGTLVSTLVHRSSTSMILGLAVWVLLVFVVPNLGVTIAQSVSEVPPADRVEMENRLAAVRSIYEALQAGKNTSGQRDFSRIMTEIRESNSRLFESYRPKLDRLIAVTRAITRVSPSGALTFLMTEMANTGLSRDLRIKDEVWLYIDRNFTRFDGPESTQVEEFHLGPESLGEQLSGPAFADGVLLLTVPLVLVALASGAFMRYDPR